MIKLEVVLTILMFRSFSKEEFVEGNSKIKQAKADPIFSRRSGTSVGGNSCLYVWIPD
jgi:hypothetical protein